MKFVSRGFVGQKAHCIEVGKLCDGGFVRIGGFVLRKLGHLLAVTIPDNGNNGIEIFFVAGKRSFGARLVERSAHEFSVLGLALLG